MKEVGIYNAALILARLISMVPTFFIPVFLPTIVELYTKKQREEFIQVIKTTSRWIFILGFPLFLIMFLYPSQILTILFGNVFIDGKVSLLLLSIGFLLFSVLGNVNIAILAALKLSRNIFYVTVVMATFDVIANYLLIPKYGISGAAAATLLTYLIGSILFLRLSYRKIGEFSVDAGFFKILISGFIAIYSITFILEYFIPLRTFPVMLISFVLMNILYALLLFFIKAIKDEDREVLLSIIQKIKYLRSRRI
jgi:O-antigen/teichoic acid export membrane protein